MTRWLTALLGCLFLAGCPQAMPPEPPGPIVVQQDDPRDFRDDSSDGAEAQTRQRALRVMAAEQRSVVTRKMRFVRIDTRTLERIREALSTSDQDLSSIERAIDALGQDDSLSSADRKERQDELKDRLRRIATRLALMEAAIHEG